MDYKKMDTAALNQMVLARIQELEQAGLVDYHFRQCHSLKEDSGPLFFMDLIPVFLQDVCAAVNEMSKTLDQPLVNFEQMYLYCIKLKGSSACIGACRISDACTHLRLSIENKSKDRCVQALNRIQHEYNCLQDQLHNIVKLEKEIASRTT